MTNRVLYGIVLVMLGGALSNCGKDHAQPWPTSPSIQPAPTPPLGSVLADATLSGMVYEVVTVSPRQIVGIEGVSVYCEQCGESSHNFASTDATGSYIFPRGVWTEGRPTFPARIFIEKAGYKDPDGLPKTTPPNPSGPGWREVVINGDTRFDAQLVRR
jgi:hypothetical protein